ncbi:betaine--homocysteine S-methyltransferase 1-like [Saccoglossus kowalevskii]|uniref:Betaine--homocysteine S-methyltransferase 1-like n=1 Tax=Saccoglossus kowalevskii TaxID=10224 RepID=A0ABM0GYQ2_SACKO|nr:PREDICTED: betaine--homocysteine S-methyltransferase 1-like [Saccoglossus kowalevskii]
MERNNDSKMVKGLMERLNDGEHVIIAEGFVFYFERMGYLQAGSWVPEVVLNHPDKVKSLYREFVDAGSDVVLAFTYYATREKTRLIGKEDTLEQLNKNALKMAREVADEKGVLMAGNICNTNIYQPGKKDREDEIKGMFKEMIEWSVEAGADFILAETYAHLGEALLAVEAIKEHGKGLPAVVTFAPFVTATKNGKAITADKVLLTEACKQVKEAGADVVGLNCGRGPNTMLPLMKDIMKVCPGPFAAIPVPYRTCDKEPTFFMLTDPVTGKKVFPTETEVCSCSREDFSDFGKQCKDLGIQFVGVCCGNRHYYTRSLAEALGRKPASTTFSPDMTKHYVYGSDAKVRKDVSEESMDLYHTLRDI